MAKTIVAQIAEMESMPVEELRGKWKTLFGSEPPEALKQKQLVARLAYRLQELTFGGLSQEARERLGQIAEMEDDRINGRKPAPNKPVPGTRYVRDWQGMRIEVTALASGFEYASKVYRSLSAIATEVTGTKWNGQQFFGLRKRDAADSSAAAQTSGRKAR